MKTFRFCSGLLSAVFAVAGPSAGQGTAWHFEFTGGVPSKLVWQADSGRAYDLFTSADLSGWTHVDNFPQAGTGTTMQYPFTAGSTGFFKIASVSLPADFAPIPAGNFSMGNALSASGDGSSGELPVHPVYVSAFYLAKNLVTWALWNDVRTWGLAHGYTDLSAGEGKAATHPVQTITWFDVVKWCNARSEREGLVPCYTLSGAVYRTTDSDAVACNWSANGYRLPTEAEWEKAARGGLSGKRFPWGDTISQSQANYMVYSSNGTTNYYAYDLTPRPGYTVYEYYHPTYNDGVSPYTSPVGSFAANGYGLCDMAGNVSEWCWDWYGNYSSGTQTDPRGAASGPSRVLRGGGWYDLAANCRVAFRGTIIPGYGNGGNGFRLARGSVP